MILPTINTHTYNTYYARDAPYYKYTHTYMYIMLRICATLHIFISIYILTHTLC